MLKSLGMTGKTHTVNELMKAHPDWIHLPQTNRVYFKEHPDEDPNNVNQTDLYEYYRNQLLSREIEDKTYISERTPLDYLLFWDYHHFFKKNPHDLILSDGTHYDDAILEDEVKFLKKFDVVDIFVTLNFDIFWMKDYIHNLPSDDIHKIFYKGRGYFIIYQDNWLKSFEKHRHVYEDIVEDIHKIEYKNFIEDSTKFNRLLIDKYDNNKLFV